MKVFFWGGLHLDAFYLYNKRPQHCNIRESYNTSTCSFQSGTCCQVPLTISFIKAAKARETLDQQSTSQAICIRLYIKMVMEVLKGNSTQSEACHHRNVKSESAPYTTNGEIYIQLIHFKQAQSLSLLSCMGTTPNFAFCFFVRLLMSGL